MFGYTGASCAAGITTPDRLKVSSWLSLVPDLGVSAQGIRETTSHEANCRHVQVSLITNSIAFLGPFDPQEGPSAHQFRRVACCSDVRKTNHNLFCFAKRHVWLGCWRGRAYFGGPRAPGSLWGAHLGTVSKRIKEASQLESPARLGVRGAVRCG